MFQPGMLQYLTEARRSKAALVDQIIATAYAGDCYRAASRAVWKDGQTAQLWERLGDVYIAAARNRAKESAR